AVSGMAESATPNVDPELEQKLNMTVQELDLSVRANNCLESARISTVREMVQQNESDLLKVRSFGKTSLKEVKKKLADMGLSLGMDLNNLPKVGEAPAAMDSFVMPEDDDEADEEVASEESA
ncbi:MAG: DNA-directed RNA polymerase subunit alpha C-terminal domain-containing protein, partial [Planctomycetota bacterium]